MSKFESTIKAVESGQISELDKKTISDCLIFVEAIARHSDEQLVIIIEGDAMENAKTLRENARKIMN
jgi:hypothetical protein